MKKARLAKAFLEELRKLPIVESARKEVGLSRQTISRWRNTDSKFEQAFQEAMREGEAKSHDIVESRLISKILKDEWPAIKYYLDHAHPKYRRELLSPDEQAMVEKMRTAKSDVLTKAYEEHERQKAFEKMLNMPYEPKPSTLKMIEQDREDLKDKPG